jgi:alkylation response protein AidB-like acyl-CoA dehydrogenase
MFIVSAYSALDSHAALFAVPRSTEGMTIKQFTTLDDDVALELHFDGAEIAASSMIADGDRASAAMRHAHRHGILALCAEAMGAMESVVTATAEHLKSRVAYGVPLSSLQVLQHKLADMVVELELSRSVMYRAINALVNHDEPAMESAVATAKAFMGDSARSIAATALQLHGAAGFARDNIISRYFKKLNAFGLRLGTTDHHFRRLAGHWEAPVRQSMLRDQILNQASSEAGA